MQHDPASENAAPQSVPGVLELSTKGKDSQACRQMTRALTARMKGIYRSSDEKLCSVVATTHQHQTKATASLQSPDIAQFELPYTFCDTQLPLLAPVFVYALRWARFPTEIIDKFTGNSAMLLSGVSFSVRQ